MQDITTTNLLETAVAAHKESNYALAEDLYRQVISLSTDNDDTLDALHYLALIYISTDQPQSAIPLLTKAVSVRGDNPEILYNLALAYQKAEDIKPAIQYYKLAIALKPDFALAYNNIGVAYQHLGELTKANANLRKAFEASPDCAEAYYNFSQSHKFSSRDDAYIKNLEQLLISRDWNKNEEIKLNFSLGKIYDDLSNYETAFKYYNKANSLKNNGFNTTQFKNYIDQLIVNYTPDLIKGLKTKLTATSKRFIFVVGMPRSGTTLVEQIIASHPTVQSAGEVGFIGEIVDELPELIHSADSYPTCIQAIKPKDITHISTAVNTQVSKFNHNFDVITDKSPINFLHLGLILLLFPDCKIIHCKRNPIDTTLSCFFQNFEKQHQYSYNMKTLALFYNEYARIMQHWQSLFPEQIYNISYENLVEQQLDESKKLLSACNLNWDDNCLSFYKSKSVVSTASKWQVRRPIYKTSVKKWKNYEKYIGDLTDNLENEFKVP